MSEPTRSVRSSYSPPFFYRATAALNAIVWRLPLPHKLLTRLSLLVYRNPPMPSSFVVEIVAALQSGGARCWISGGWGVDALAGRPTRTHRDLDLVVEDGALSRAREILASLGFAEWYSVDSERPLFTRVMLSDHPAAGRAVDLHPLDTSSEHVQFTTGTIDGEPVPCLSAESQVTTHSNYRKRLRDRVDLATLRRVLDGAGTALVVPVELADELRDQSACDDGLPAHVTVLQPFMRSRLIGDRIVHELRQTIGRVPAFDFTLSDVRRFPNVVYLAPEPAGPFVELTRALAQRWPEFPPYGGVFEQIVPHLTVAYGRTPPARLQQQLPLRARADEVWLMARVGNRWSCHTRFALGQARAPFAGAQASLAARPER
ncbi:MAG: nucleotidyltransferase domain-containing protein [Solirubrobacteraceae bacterium]